MKPAEAQEWLIEASRYFAKRDTGGEDMAFWANKINSDNCRFIAQLIGAQENRVIELSDALQYLVAESDEDMDNDYNPHARPLARARAALNGQFGSDA